MPRSFFAFALATLLPLPLLLAGALFGGWASWLALAYVTVIMASVDALLPALGYDGEAAEDEEADLLSQLLVGVHFVLLFVVIWSLAGGGPGLFSGSGLALFVATAMFLGQVSNSNAHELIHRRAKHLRLMGRWVFISLLFGHHASAHPMVHHRYVCTPDDPNTARLNETCYRYMPRAWLGSFKAGYAAERKRMTHKGLPDWHWSNPYASYIGGALLMLLLSWMIAGIKGVLVHLLLAGFAQWQLLISDYVQHYGLERKKIKDDAYEPVNETHSWNAPHWLSSLWMLNAPRHSDHHAHPSRPYTQLTIPERGTAPMLPYALPVMATLALHPKAFRRVMNPHVEAWRTP